jgi:polysaccharide export outer membrane protein
MNFRSPPSMLLSLACACLALCLAGCGGGDSGIRPGTSKAVESTGPSMAPPDTTSSGGVYTGVTDYRIGPQDVIEISVFQVPDLNRTVRVNSVGQVSLPLIGSIQAGGLTIQELEKSIGSKLEAKFLQNPQVTAFVKEFTSQRVTVEGAVKTAGIFPLSGRTTLLQTIAMAGGLDQLANPRGIVIFRQIGGKKMAAKFDLKAIRAGSAEDPLVYGDDIIVVDQSGAKTAARRLLETIPIFNFFSAY